MALTTETNFYRYVISGFDITYPDSSVKNMHHADILSIGIEKDFENCYYPLLSVKLLLDYETYYKIIENKTTVKFKFKFTKYIADKTGSNTDLTKNRFLENVFDCTFGIYIDDDIIAMNKELYETTKETIGEQETRKMYEFYLFKDEDLSSGKYTENCIVSNSNLTNVLAYLFANSGITNLLMSPLENNKTYSEILIPYIPLIQVINFLEKHYGLYKAGSLFFYDFNMTYFISKLNKNVYKTGEINTVVVTVFKPGTGNSLTPGCYNDKVKKALTIYVSQDSFSPLTESIIQEQTTGTNVAVVNSSSDSVDSIEPSINTRSGKTTKVIVNKFENSYLDSMVLFNKLENNKIIDVEMVEVDLSFLTPNKIFIFTFEDKASQKAYGGKYRLVYTMDTFERGGDDFKVKVKARFKTIDFKQTI